MKLDETVEKAKQFLKESFIAHPHYSFNDWHIMYDHSVKVYRNSLWLAAMKGGDLLVISLGALFHDIGKTKELSDEMLHKHHADYNYEQAEEFINTLSLDTNQTAALISVLNEEPESLERKIISDADLVSFYEDPSLYMAYKTWVDTNNVPNGLEEKLRNMGNLFFPEAIERAKIAQIKMRRAWGK